MKINLWCDSGANANSCRKETIDLSSDWNISDEEWNAMTEKEKEEQVMDWANDYLDIGWSEIED